MSALFYLYRTRIKNKLKKLIRSPGQIIFVLFLTAMMVLNLFARKLDGDSPVTQYRDISELYAIIAALYAVMFALVCYGGISRGGSLFSMPDVNLIFVSPTSPVKIVFYGLVQQLGTSIVVGIFILFQYTLLNSNYGVTFPFLLLILLGYALVLVCGQLTSIIIFSRTSGNERNRRIAKGVILGLNAALAGYVLLYALFAAGGLTGDKGALFAGVVEAASGWVVSLVPVFGWLRYFVYGCWSGSLLAAVAGMGGTLLYIAAAAALMTRSGDDFYEDVLKSTEKSFQVLAASKAGNVAEAVPENVKLGRLGIRKGFGASTLYYKHALEDRRAKVFLLDTASIIFLIMNIIFAFVFRSMGVLLYFTATTYMMMFSVFTGRWIKELVRPYVFLIPEPPFKKLMFCLGGTLKRLALEAVLLFAVAVPILGLTIFDFFLLAAARITFGLIFLASNLFVDRFFSFVQIKAIAILLCFLSMIVFALPGVICGIILSTIQVFSLSADHVVLLSTIAGNILVALGGTFASRNMLEYAELNTQG